MDRVTTTAHSRDKVTQTFAVYNHQTTQIITSVSLATTRREKVVLSSSAALDLANNSNVYFRVNTRDDKKKKKTNTREQRKMKWGEEGYERPGAERMKGREKTDNHSFAG